MLKLRFKIRKVEVEFGFMRKECLLQYLISSSDRIEEFIQLPTVNHELISGKHLRTQKCKTQECG